MKAELTETEIEARCRILERQICAKLKELKGTIGDDYRASDDPEDDKPGMQITVATKDLSQWNFQTGDNSYSGGCYGLPHWAVSSLHRRSNCAQLAKDLVEEMATAVSESAD